MALKAAKMGNPPPGLEGEIYRELRRTRAAGQGICVMNSAGKVLAWSLGFEDDKQVGNFFDHCKKLYATSPDSGVTTERYRTFPGVKLPGIADNGKQHETPPAHTADESCPGDLPLSPGGMRGRIVGRAYGDDGKPRSDVRSQDSYVEDILEISKPMQVQLIAAAQSATGRFQIPPAMAREFVENAYLGMLDVNPLGGEQVRAMLLGESIEFRAERKENGRLLVTGESRVRAKNREDVPSDAGRIWSHEVMLQWRGFIDYDDKGLREVALLAEGKEKLKWGGPGSHVSPTAGENPAAHLMSGRPLDINTTVRYGLTAER